MKNFILFLALTILVSGCAIEADKTITEQDIEGESADYNEGAVIKRIDEINKGATPKVKSSNKSKATTMTNEQPKQVQLDNLAAEYSQAVIKTNLGDITVEFYAQESPITVNNFFNLARDGFFNGTRFHRVINDFMIQGGDPLSSDVLKKEIWGTGGPGYKFQDEFNEHPLQKGSLAMANSGPNTNGSQFFIVTKDFTPWLDGKHTNFGYVTLGMDVVEKIEAVGTDGRDRPVEDVIIEKIELLK